MRAQTALHLHTTRAVFTWAQVLAKAGGKNLFMLPNSNGDSCLYIAAKEGHADVAEVLLGACRLRDRKESLCYKE